MVTQLHSNIFLSSIWKFDLKIKIKNYTVLFPLVGIIATCKQGNVYKNAVCIISL